MSTKEIILKIFFGTVAKDITKTSNILNPYSDYPKPPMGTYVTTVLVT